jgi:hypothetical protein
MWLKTIIVYSYPVIALIGLAANCLSFLIFSRKKFKKTVFSIYYRFYLAFQILNLITPINKMLELNFAFHFTRISDFTCKIRHYYMNANYSISSTLLTVISIDRYLSICHSTKYFWRKNPTFQILTSCIVILFNFLFNSLSLVNNLKEIKTNRTNETKISFKCIPPGITYDLMKLLQHSLIPFCLMIIFTLLTLKTIFNSRNNINSKRLQSKDVKFAIASIVNNLIFFLFQTPYTILTIIDDYVISFDSANLNDLKKLLQAIFYSFAYINLGLTFFINYFVNSMFRKEIEVLLYGKERPKTSNKQQSETRLL